MTLVCGMAVYVFHEMGHPLFAACLIRNLIDHIAKGCCFRENLVNVSLLDAHKARIVQSRIRGYFPVRQSQAIDVVAITIEALGKTSRMKALE